MSFATFPASYIYPSTSSHTHTIILLHGRGSSGAEFAEDLFSSCTSSSQSLPSHLPNCRWVFPSAKQRWSTVFQEEMSEWFDIYSLSNPYKERERQTEGLREGLEHIKRLVEEETKLVGSQNIVLGGVSQGMAMALHTVLRGRVRVGAFVGSSWWVPLAEESSSLREDEEKEEGSVEAVLNDSLALPLYSSGLGSRIPVFLGHGKDDGIVEFRLGEQARDVLRSLGMTVEWRAYEGAEEQGHWLKEPEEFDDIVAFLEKLVGKQ